MITPFAHINAATIRAERRAHLRRQLGHAVTLAVIAILMLVVADMALTTALALPETLATAASLKGM